MRRRVLLGLVVFLWIGGGLWGGNPAEAQTYNVVWILDATADPNPFQAGTLSTTITIETFEFAQWFWLFPTTMVRPTIVVQVADRWFIANMTSEWLGQRGFFGWWVFWWYTQTGQWTHQTVWDGRDLAGNLVPPGPYLATVTVYAGGSTAFGSVVLNVQSQKRLLLTLTPAEIRPEQRTEVKVEARDDQNNPLPNYPVTLEAFAPQFVTDPCADCGGHSHDTNRPIGIFYSLQGDRLSGITLGTTGPNGEPWVLLYEASLQGGVETIAARGTQEPAVREEKRLEVKVPNLGPLESRSNLITWTSSERYHKLRDSDYGTSYSNSAVYYAVSEYSKLFKLPTSANLAAIDMSLPKGGLFDIGGDWLPPHTLHREGRSVDFSSKYYRDSIGNIINVTIYKKGKPVKTTTIIDDDKLDQYFRDMKCKRYEKNIGKIHYECPK